MSNNEQNNWKTNVLSSAHWIRLVFMVLFALFLQVASWVMIVVIVVQFLFSLIIGKNNAPLRQLGSSLSKFIYQTLQFLTYSSEEKPFPFADWPEADSAEDLVSEDVPVLDTKVEANTVTDGDVELEKTELNKDEFETVEALEAEDTIKQEDA